MSHGNGRALGQYGGHFGRDIVCVMYPLKGWEVHPMCYFFFYCMPLTDFTNPSIVEIYANSI